MSNMVIAIDGPSASGKSTIAKLVAEKLGAHYINTGNMYRAAALAAINTKLDLDNIDKKLLSKFIQDTSVTYTLPTDGKMLLILNGKPVDPVAIRSPKVSQNSSKIAASKIIREWLVSEQRTFTKFGLIIMEGRDIGTNVFPDAQYKFFLTASPEVRAMRRLRQDESKPSKENIALVAREIKERDERDSKRKTAPLRQADDAILVDSSNININEVVDYIVDRVHCSRRP
jgi:CMP/dCMP kinase